MKLTQAGVDRQIAALEKRLAELKTLRATMPVDRVKFICQAVCREFGIRRRELFSPHRPNRICYARFAAWLLLRQPEFIRLSYPHIGLLFKRDHGTVLSGVVSAENLYETDADFRQLVNNLKRCCREKFSALKPEAEAAVSHSSPGAIVPIAPGPLSPRATAHASSMADTNKQTIHAAPLV